MKKAVVFIATGFEEIEAIGTIDVLRRGGIDVTISSITGSKTITGAHGISMKSDVLFNEMDYNHFDAFILPGGMPGATNLNAHVPLKELLINQYKEGKVIAAICAAPLVLGGLGLLRGKSVTCYPGFEPKLIEATPSGGPVEVDGNVITGKGPGLVFHFALSILKALKGDAVAEEVASGLLL